MADEKADGGLHERVGVLGERVAGVEKNLSGQIDGLSRQLSSTMSELRASFATTSALDVVKSDLAGTNKRLDFIASFLNWGVKIVLAAVIMAVLGTVFVKGGVTHP